MPFDAIWNAVSQWSGTTDEGALNKILPNRQSFPGKLLQNHDVFRERQSQQEIPCENEGLPVSCIPKKKVIDDNDDDMDDFFKIDDIIDDNIYYTDDAHTDNDFYNYKDDNTDQDDDYLQINDFSYIDDAEQDDYYADDHLGKLKSDDSIVNPNANTENQSNALSIVLSVISGMIVIIGTLVYVYRTKGAKEKIQRRYKYLVDVQSNDETFEVSFSDLGIDNIDSPTLNAT